MAHNVIAEAKRCLNCKKPLCRQGCPINTDIPNFISTFLKGDIEAAGKMLFDNNPLSVVCSIVCNHGNQCQGHCVRGLKGEPVEISTIENYISERYLDSLVLERQPSNGIKVAVIGSGPAGITISIKLAQLGYDVTVFESKTDIGGVLRYGIPDFRLPHAIIDRYKQIMLHLGIKIRLNVTIGKAFGIEELFRDGFKAISIGTGVTWPIALNIKGETLGHVHYGVHFLERPEGYELGKSVIVIGAGNVAMDVARTALRRGVRDVKIVVRSDRYTASEEEKEYAEIEGAQFIFNKAPIEITDEGVIFADTVCDENHKVISVSKETELMKADTVMICVSQRPSNLILTNTQGLETNDRGLAKIDSQTGETTRPGVFASGDVVKGAKTVVEAVEQSKRVAFAMHEYLQSLPKE
ncbi:MAG TPA: NAD(P)-dependent oxidoreductase [Candidatus Coproplasma excrementipullorum]|nr:NAD(P)-dependent oxidoreductase [Candidatus Coproplasma excrementipullorum]